MREIFKTVCLENYKSRTPSILKWYAGEYEYSYSNDNKDEILSKRINNYGNIIGSITVPENIGTMSGKILSYTKVASIYAFFRKYYQILNSGSFKYHSIQEANLYEGTAYDETMDEDFEKYGGDLMYEWLNTIFPRFKIPSQFADEWESEYLSFYDFLTWLGWFKKAYTTCHSQVIEKDDLTNCCLCNKYSKLGGDEMLDAMESWYEAIDLTAANDLMVRPYINLPICILNNTKDMGEMSTMAEEWEPLENYSSSTLNGGTIVQYNGKDFKLKDGYKGYLYSNKFKEGYFGNKSENDEEIQEWIDEDETIVDVSEQWERNISNNLVKLAMKTPEEYTYKGNDIILSPNAVKMAKKYQLNHSDSGYIIYKGNVYEIFGCDYVIMSSSDNLNGKKFKVYYEDDERKLNPYTFIGSKRYYAYFDSTDGRFYFYFKKTNCENEIKSEILEDGTFVEINGILYNADGNILIKGMKYNPFNDYAMVDGNYVVIDNNETYYYGLTENNGDEFYGLIQTDLYGEYINPNLLLLDRGEYQGFSVYEGNFLTLEPYPIYSATKINGTTDSKLSLFQSKQMVTDLLGNVINGVYQEIIPPQNAILDIPFTIGSVYHLENYPSLNTEYKKYFWGDILTSIEYYVKDEYGQKIFSYLTDINETSFLNEKNYYNLRKTVYFDYEKDNSAITSGITNYSSETMYSSASIIDDLKNDLEDYLVYCSNENCLFKRHSSIDDNVYVEFHYYIGAMIFQENDGNTKSIYKLSYACDDNENKHFYGIHYFETATIEKKTINFQCDDIYFYNINYYDLIFKTEKSNLLGLDQTYNVANFEMPITSYYNENGEFKSFYDGDSCYEDYNGYNDLPLFREDYKFGAATVEKVKSNVYVERGRSNAFEKHLKLLEVKTSEDLVNYSNGYFSIE